MTENPKWPFVAAALAFTFMLILASICQANPIPVNYRVKTSEEDLNVYIYLSRALVEGIYTFEELRLSLLIMRCDYDIQFKAAENKFAWIETSSTDKNAYAPRENVTLETAVRRGNDMLAVVYEAEIRYRLLLDGEDMGFLGSSHIEIPSANGRATARFTFQLPDKPNRSGKAAIQAELWSWNISLEDVKEVLLEIRENGDGELPTAEQPAWASATIAITAAAAVTLAVVAIIAVLYRRKFKCR